MNAWLLFCSFHSCAVLPFSETGDLFGIGLQWARFTLMQCGHKTTPVEIRKQTIDPGVKVSQSKLQHLKVTTDGSDRDFKDDVRFIDGQGVSPSSHFGGFEPHAVNAHVNLRQSIWRHRVNAPRQEPADWVLGEENTPCTRKQTVTRGKQSVIIPVEWAIIKISLKWFDRNKWAWSNWLALLFTQNILKNKLH